MAYPTTLALITALWSGPGRTRSIALWSAVGGVFSALGPLASGALLQHFDWGSDPARSGGRFGVGFCLLGFLAMLLPWDDGAAYWRIGLAYALVGLGVGFAGTPASRSLTSSVPVRRAGMASGTADLQRDPGGAIMQSILGVLLTAGYAKSFFLFPRHEQEKALLSEYEVEDA